MIYECNLFLHIAYDSNLYFLDPPPLELVKGKTSSLPFYADFKVMVPLIIAILAIFGAAAAATFCWKNSELIIIDTFTLLRGRNFLLVEIQIKSTGFMGLCMTLKMILMI